VAQQSPLVEDPVPPSMQYLASPLEVYTAQVQELLLILRETLDPQAELEERVSEIEGRTNRLPVIESVAAEASTRLADSETRIAALERLIIQGHP
jgi:hypothetical protein